MTQLEFKKADDDHWGDNKAEREAEVVKSRVGIDLPLWCRLTLTQSTEYIYATKNYSLFFFEFYGAEKKQITSFRYLKAKCFFFLSLQCLSNYKGFIGSLQQKEIGKKLFLMS